MNQQPISPEQQAQPQPQMPYAPQPQQQMPYAQQQQMPYAPQQQMPYAQQPQMQYAQQQMPYAPVQPAMAAGVEQKSRVAYILLGVFLGGLGMHNFYAGYTGRGIAQLLISVLSLFMLSFISCLWALIDVCTVKQDGKGIPFAS